MGLPIVSTSHSGIPEVVNNEINGYLVSEGDISGMSNALMHLIKNPRQREKMGAAGQKHILKNYNNKNSVGNKTFLPIIFILFKSPFSNARSI